MTVGRNGRTDRGGERKSGYMGRVWEGGRKRVGEEALSLVKVACQEGAT